MKFYLIGILGVAGAVCQLSASAGTISAVDEPTRVLLKNQRTTIALGKTEKGAIVSMIDAATGRELASGHSRSELFSLSFSKKGQEGAKPVWVSSQTAVSVKSSVATAASRCVATLEYDGLGEQPVHVTCTATVAEGDPLVRWRLSATFPESLVLEEVQFPCCILRAPLGEGVAGESATLGSTKGGVVRWPSGMSVGSRVQANQPGSLAAQFGCYYDDQVGFYSAAYDGRGTPKSAIVLRLKEGIQFSWSNRCFASKTFGIDYDLVMTCFGGTAGQPADWRDAADLYKQWALTQPWCAHLYGDRTDLPAWMKDGPAMVRFGRDWLAKPERIENWLRNYWQKNYTGVPLITAYWGWEKIGSWVTPDYFPIYPSDEQFTALVAASRKLGCHAFPWPSGYHWTLTYNNWAPAHDKKTEGPFDWDDRKHFDEVARAHAVHLRDGQLYLRTPSWLNGGQTSCLCPGDPWTLRWWNNDICVPLARRGAEMIQVDQVVGGSFPACYRPEHQHPRGPGPWMTAVFEEQLKGMLAACRAVEPDSVVCFEEPNERFNHLVGIQDYRDCEASGELASVFNYLYHEYLPTFQSNPQAGDLMMMAYCFANGQIPHFVPASRLGGELVLLNGNFEEKGEHGQVGWDQVHSYQGHQWTGKGVRDESEKHEGAASLRLENVAESDVVQISQNVRVGNGLLVGKNYRLSAWLKTDHMAKPNAINFALLTTETKSVGKGGRLLFPKAGAGWQKVTQEFTVAEGAALLRIMIHLDGPAKAWVDDMVLEELLADGSTRMARTSETPPDHLLMKRWVGLYHGEGRPFLQFGRMLHLPKLTTTSVPWRKHQLPVLIHNAYRAPDGSEAVIVVNGTTTQQSGTLTWKGREQHLVVEPCDAVLVK